MTPPASQPLTGYEAQKERSRDRQMQLSESGRDIGKMPEVVDPERKERARFDFRYFCEQYHPETFPLEWSNDHLVVINRVERCVLEGGLFAMAMPRGSGKSTISEIAAEWAVLFGHRDYVCLIGSDEAHAKGMLESIKSEIENNEHLLADFPEVCFPVQALEGINQRAKGQLYQGELTRIRWKEDQVVLPTVENSQASAGIIEVAGITGRIRGMKFKRPDGKQVRPSLVILDDPQTDESARSPSQCKTRERVLSGAILGLAGPGKKIAGIMPCTVIVPDDMADSILDRQKHPHWQGERMKMMYEFPSKTALWDKYAKLLEQSLEIHGDIRDATAFYGENRVQMDEGARVAWESRFENGELSAIQNAMNLNLKDPVAFWSEYQNEPLPEDEDSSDLITEAQVLSKRNGRKRREIPVGCDTLTMMIDVQEKALYYKVVAWESDFTGYIIDYGTYPEQKTREFTLRNLKHTLKMAKRGAGLEGAIYAGLESLQKDLIERDWQRDDGTVLRIARCMIDANWSKSTDVVYQYCRESSLSTVLTPSHGQGVTASGLPMNERKKKRGERVGHYWRMPVGTGKRTIRYIVYDTNYWKSFVHTRLGVHKGDPGCLSIYQASSAHHAQMIRHLRAEQCVRTEGRGRKVEEWKNTKKEDNHWFDTLVGCAVGASMEGVKMPHMNPSKGSRTKKRIKISEIQRNRR